MLIIMDRSREYHIHPDTLFYIYKFYERKLEKDFPKGNSAVKLKATNMPSNYYKKLDYETVHNTCMKIQC